MEFTEADRKMLSDMHAVLLGVEGNGGGLCKKVGGHEGRIHRLEIIAATAAGAGLLTGGTALVKLIGG